MKKSSKNFPPKVFFDTNVLVAALISEGLCHKLLRRAARGEISAYISPYILKELKEVLRNKVGVSNEDISAFVDLLLIAMEVVDPEEAGLSLNGICRDPHDDPVIAGAVAAAANYLVSGDLDLLELQKYQSIMIVSPRQLEDGLFQTLLANILDFYVIFVIIPGASVLIIFFAIVNKLKHFVNNLLTNYENLYAIIQPLVLFVAFILLATGG